LAELGAENRRLEERERELEAHASSVDGRVAELEAENGRRARGIVELEAYARSVEAKSAELEGQLQQRRVRAGIALGRLADRLRPHREPR
jgi:predicted nuclease with TOPRIM domain